VNIKIPVCQIIRPAAAGAAGPVPTPVWLTLNYFVIIKRFCWHSFRVEEKLQRRSFGCHLESHCCSRTLNSFLSGVVAEGLRNPTIATSTEYWLIVEQNAALIDIEASVLRVTFVSHHAFSALTLLVGGRKGIWPVKN